jgi:hypothetical protein
MGERQYQHQIRYDPKNRTARCSCGLWAAFGATIDNAAEPFAAHVQRELEAPTEHKLWLRANSYGGRPRLAALKSYSAVQQNPA